VTIDATSRRPARPIRAHRQIPAIVVSKPKPTSAELLAENAILCDQIGERLSFPARQPANDH
jgi:hypothetical protein